MKKLSFPLAGIMLFLSISACTPDPAAERAKDQSLMAHIQCKDFVKSRLKAPATAEFPTLEYRASRYGESHQYLILSHVDAQNAFGAKIRSRYLCEVEWNGEEYARQRNWKLRSLEFVD